MEGLGLARSIGETFRIRYDDENAQIDNFIFRLHYRYTTFLLFFASGIVAGGYILEEPIRCYSSNSHNMPAAVLNAYCWIATTFTVPTPLDYSDVIIPNRLMETNTNETNTTIETNTIETNTNETNTNETNTNETESKYQSYYQWVPLVLFFQGILFYFPHFLWKNWENARMFMLTSGLRGPVIDDWQARQSVQTRLSQFVVDRFNKFGVYATQYLFCETLNLINVICNIIFINRFLGGAFLSYGLNTIYFSGKDQELRYDPIVTVFPKITNCTLTKYGPSGTIETLDAECILELNMYNEKIYVLLWFWLFVLTILSSLALAYSIAALISKRYRLKIMITRFFVHDSSKLAEILKNANIDDYLLFRQIGKTVNALVFNELISQIYEMMSPNEPACNEEEITEVVEELYFREKKQLKKSRTSSRSKHSQMTKGKQVVQNGKHVETKKSNKIKSQSDQNSADGYFSTQETDAGMELQNIGDQNQPAKEMSEMASSGSLLWEST